MNKEQLLASASNAYYAQLKREHEYRQSIRAGKIELCPQSRVTVEQLYTNG